MTMDELEKLERLEENLGVHRRGSPAHLGAGDFLEVVRRNPNGDEADLMKDAVDRY